MVMVQERKGVFTVKGEHLIIDGNAVYEIDPECMKQWKEAWEQQKRQSAQEQKEQNGWEKLRGNGKPHNN